MGEGDPHAAGVERLVSLAEAQEKRSRRKELATAIAALVALAFMVFVGYCAWTFVHEMPQLR